jgi:2-C-methyl-D-erythritol 4-phosphate cytidylyltransferase
MSNAYAVILAGGRGERMRGELPKQLLPLGGKSIIAWSIDAFARIDEVRGILIVSHPDCAAEIASIAPHHASGKLIGIVAGGETRQGSSYNALCALDCRDGDIVAIHDAARPFVSGGVIRAVLSAAREHGAAGAYVRATDTISEGKDGFVTAIPERSGLYYTQTPQAFRFEVIMDAHQSARERNRASSTDDAGMVLDAGGRVRIVDGDYRNIKITSPADYEAAKALASRGLEA